MKCSTCDEVFEPLEGENRGQTMVRLQAHRREAHPGVAGTGNRAKKPGRGRGRPRRDTNAPPAAEPGGSAPGAGGAPDDEPRPELAPTGETAPGLPPPARRSFRDRLWGGGDDTPSSSSSSLRPTREKRPASRKRVSTAGMLSMLWGGAGLLAVRSGADVPVGRCMQYQSTAAGEILERLTKDTVLDKMLQPLASRAEDMEALGALVALPMLVGIIERNPDAAPVLEPMLRAAIRHNFLAMVPAMKKAKADEAKWAEAVTELGLEGPDPIGAMIDAMFAPIPQPEPAPSAAPVS